MLFKQRVEGNATVSEEKFTSLYQQKTNRKMPLLGSRPYFYFYMIGKAVHFRTRIEKKMERVKQKYDQKILEDSADKQAVVKWQKKKEAKLEKLKVRYTTGNSFMRTFGEAPSIAKRENIDRTSVLMKQMLRAKGYFHSKIAVKYDTNGKKLTVIYLIEEGQPHTIDTLYYTLSNRQIQLLIDSASVHSYIKKNGHLDEADLILERDRIDKLLKDNGYFDFEKQAIAYKIDTTYAPFRARVEVSIKNPEGTTFFRKYHIDNVYCYLEYNKFGKQKIDTVVYDKVRFVEVKNKYGKKVLAGKIKLRPGDLYRAERTLSTQLNIANLDNFKYIDIRYQKTNPNDSVLTVNIVLNSSKKYQITDEWGLNVTQGLPGPQGSISFLDRNVLKGCENFDFSVRYSIEGVASATNPDIVYKSVEAAADAGLTFPQFYIPTRIRFKFNNLYPRTRLNFAFNNIIRPEYTRRNYKLALNYNFTRNVYSRYIFAIADLNVIQTFKQTTAFASYLDTLASQGNTLKSSFQPSFVSSMSFTYLYNNNDFTKFATGNFFRWFVESGGTTMHFLESQLRNEMIIRDELLFGQLAYYKFIKSSADFRRYEAISPKSQIAFRINAGAAVTFGKDVLPYEKYFFAGGSSSLRAWRPRRLGPGSRPPRNYRANGAFDYRFEQPAEMVLESSLESRFKLIKFFEGALFLDVGNVWQIRNALDSEDPSVFSLKRFYKELAVGTGVGLRLNFTFIIVRFDLGLKVLDPAMPEEDRLVVKKWTLGNIFSTNEYGLLNLGIGYPF